MKTISTYIMWLFVAIFALNAPGTVMAMKGKNKREQRQPSEKSFIETALENAKQAKEAALAAHASVLEVQRVFERLETSFKKEERRLEPESTISMLMERTRRLEQLRSELLDEFALKERLMLNECGDTPDARRILSENLLRPDKDGRIFEGLKVVREFFNRWKANNINTEECTAEMKSILSRLEELPLLE